jgi:uncharacterized protein YndB with AHSA1/START domain
MTAENPGTVIIKRRFDFSIERVFDAWLDPAKASKFRNRSVPPLASIMRERA